MTTTTQKRPRRRLVAIALVGIGVAGLATASASMLTVSATDNVASGRVVETTGGETATATIETVRRGTAAPDAAGAVPVDLLVAVDKHAGWAGTVYLDDTAIGSFTVAAPGADATVTTTGLTSHTALDNLSVVLTPAP